MDRQIVNRRYRLERKIGEGGTAEVYLGFDIVLNRRVAIKTLRRQYASNRAFRLRFEREAQSAARFSHPNIISIFDVGEDHGLPYIVMEYIDGQTLREIIDEEGPFHPDDVAVLVEQVAAGLDFAHQHGLVHRDVKPQNILVDRHGLAKVVDFGIAKGLSDSTLTETGTSLGTVHYISPEQASGLMATPESDIYSLGVIAYEMLTGQLPFESDSAVGIAMRHLNDPPPDPAELNPDVPPEAADIVLQALAKNPTRRFPSAGAFARSLGDWRMYQAAPRLAAKYVAPIPPTPPASRDPFETVPSIRSIDPTRTAPPVEDAAQVPPAERFDEPEASSGRSWLAGLIAVVALAAILWYGFDLPDRLSAGGDDGDSTPTVQVLAGSSPSATATPTPTATVSPTETAEPNPVTVPDVIRASRADAESALTDRGFRVVLGEPVASDVVPEGAVAEQHPVAGTQSTEGATITLSLSSGPEPVDLAALRAPGRPATDVAEELTSAGLNVTLIDEGNRSVDEG
ncbi:MAG: Stk1 family PASTA domain-containing Ser/Thr kinase, partial [Thermomicrobiales bacterium]|nr:Stk1 family PASTA domain-containing Ser/Thr kinase [Thermomicrobiales bacterium]